MEVAVQRLKADIGNRQLKVAVEVDGHSHKCKAVQAKDRRKGQVFAAAGWRMIRFWNWEILETLPAVLRKITRFATSKQGQPTTSPMAS